MNNIKALINKRFKILSTLIVLLSLSIVLLMFRIKLTHSFFYLFLVWNLFLAVIPYLTSTYLVYKNYNNTYKLFFGFLFWLAFLPNAPYILTDLWHLRLAQPNIIWLDIIIVASFAVNGLLLFYLSMMDMIAVLKKKINSTIIKILPLGLVFLSSFGIYLGRFLRYNSWEILSNPKLLFSDIITIILKPYTHKEAWYFTLIFTIFLYTGFWAFNTLHKPNNNVNLL